MSTVIESLQETTPNLPETHYVDNRLYTDQGIFAEERERVFRRVWNFVCHESEVRTPGDFRVVNVAGFPILLARGQDGVLRAFYNICRHRAAPVVRQECGNAKAFQCFYHLWTYGLDGQLIGVTRPEGYAGTGFRKEDFPLLLVRVEVAAGLVFVCLSEETEALREYLGELLSYLEEPLAGGELEVLHYHQAVIKTNSKLWMDNNTESYHGFLHVLNRRTGSLEPGPLSRKRTLFANGHTMLGRDGLASADYEAGRRDARGDYRFPGLAHNEGLHATFFPDTMTLWRTTVLRIDRMVPLSPGRTLVEWRGLGLKSDTPEVRALRLHHHNQFWGPAGRNLPEDIMAVETQWECMQSGAMRYSIFAREEELRAQDDGNVRHFYQEWGRRMGRDPARPFDAA